MSKLGRALEMAAWALLVGIVVLLLAGFLLAWWLQGRWLRYQFEVKWGQHGKRVLLVYSETREWQQYVAEERIAGLRERAVLLKWARRSEMKRNAPLETKIFSHWGDDRMFNPTAIYLPKWGKVKTIRFRQAFKDFRHGKEQELRKTRDQLAAIVDRLATRGA